MERARFSRDVGSTDDLVSKRARSTLQFLERKGAAVSATKDNHTGFLLRPALVSGAPDGQHRRREEHSDDKHGAHCGPFVPPKARFQRRCVAPSAATGCYSANRGR